MDGPRTKLGTLPPLTPHWRKVRGCLECQAFVEAWAYWCPTPRQTGGYVGRPKVVLGVQPLLQAALFSARWLMHLRMTAAGMASDVLEVHLRMNSMGEWIPAVRALRPYLQRDAVSWGELGVINARRWRDDVQYQGVRRLLADRLGLNQRSLRRRFDERAYWGVSLG